MPHDALPATAAMPIARLRFALALALLAVAFLLGATSGAIPMRGMLIELVALAGLVAALWDRRDLTIPRPATALILLALLVPLAQLVPLPPAIWHLLPGREVAAEIAVLLLPDLWQPISIAPGATFASWLCILPPLALFLLTVRLDADRRAVLLTLYVALALASVLLGVVQGLTASGFYLYPTIQPVRLPTGLFSNRNHQAIFLVTASVAALALGRLPPFRDRAGARIGAPVLAALLAACVIGTASRSGLVLLGVPLLFGLWPLFGAHIRGRWLIVGAVLVAAAVTLLLGSAAMRQVLARFANDAGEGRLLFWPDVAYAARSYFPFGAGLGNFVRAYESTEALATINRFTINHAHDEYLEVVVESGIAGIAQIALLIAFVARQGVRILRHRRAQAADGLGVAALLMVVVLALHSLVEFPMRSFALLTTSGLLLALLVPPPSTAPDVAA